MSESAIITPDAVRAYANLPSEVPEALIAEHIEIAKRDLVDATGLEVAPEGNADEWLEALKVRALASVFPWLNTFALDGAAKVGRLEGSVEYRFLDAEDVEEKIKNLGARFEDLVARIAPPETAETPTDVVSFDGFTMIAI